MSAATVVAGFQFRRAWRPLIALSVMVALASGLAMAGIADGQSLERIRRLPLLLCGNGTIAEPVVPFGALALAAAVVIALASLAGWVPAVRALRHLPADVLRTE